MRTLRDFCCQKCEMVFERYLDSETKQVTCECGGTADRLIGMPTVALDGTDPGFPGAYEKWARTREQRAAIHAKRSYKEP